MTDQDRLFEDGYGEPTTRRTDPSTSHAAARDAAVHAGTLRARCYRALEAAGMAGLTDAELSDRTGLQLNSANKRRGELRDAGLVVDTGRRRPTPSGSSAIVWAVAGLEGDRG